MDSSILIVGHVCYDIRDGKKVLGGPALFMYPILKRVFDKVDLLTSAHSSFPFPIGANIHLIPSELTTVFKYQDNCSEDRCISLKSKASDIDWFPPESYDVVIVSGIAGEIRPDVLKTLSTMGALCFIDMQTLVRTFNSEGNLEIKKDNNLKIAQSNCDFVKASDQEVTGVPNRCIVTSKEKITANFSRLISVNNQVNNNPIDTTGSGDVFLSGFVISYYLTNELEYSLRFGASLAEENVKHFGIASEEVYAELIDHLWAKPSEYP